MDDKGRKSGRWERIGVVAGVASLIIAFLGLAYQQCWLGSCDDSVSPPDIRIDATSSLLNAPGYDRPSAEYVCLVSSDDEPVSLAGWQLREGSGDVVNTLPAFTLAPGASVRVHPGEGRNSRHDLYGESSSPVWNNGGDSVTLVDSREERIASVSYGEKEEADPAGPCR